MGDAIAVRDLVVNRGGKPVLHGVSIDVAAGEITALVGANGAGKSTLVTAMAGAIPPERGTISLGAERLHGLSADRMRRRGIAVVPEGHRVLATLSVHDNLRAAGSMMGRLALKDAIDQALLLFPELKARLDVSAGALSGGQKQMVSMSQALICRPTFLLIDELSLGLAPLVVKRLAGALQEIAGRGVGILLIEQFTTLALGLAQAAYVMERGRIVFAGTATALRERPDILHSAYLSGSLSA